MIYIYMYNTCIYISIYEISRTRGHPNLHVFALALLSLQTPQQRSSISNDQKTSMAMAKQIQKCTTPHQSYFLAERSKSQRCVFFLNFAGGGWKFVGHYIKVLQRLGVLLSLWLPFAIFYQSFGHETPFVIGGFQHFLPLFPPLIPL